MRVSGMALLGLAVASALGCATAKPKAAVVWPPPPDVARIRFVTAFRQTSDLDTSTSSQLMRVLLGGDREAMLGRPMGLALSPDGKRLYIADSGLLAVFVADFEKKTLTELAGVDSVGTAFGVAVDSDEHIYVADQTGKRVVVLDRHGAVIRHIGKDAGLVRPSGVALDVARRLVYVSDPATLRTPDHRVLVFTFEGELVRTLGKGRGPEKGQFHFPIFLAVDPEGRLFVGDTMNFRVQVFSPEGNFIRAHGDNGVGPGSFARIKGVAFDSFSNLYVVEGEYAVVQMFNREFQALMYFGGTAPKLEYLELPTGIAIDPKTNRIYVANALHPRVNVYELVNTKPEDSLAPAPAPAPAAAAAPAPAPSK